MQEYKVLIVEVPDDSRKDPDAIAAVNTGVAKRLVQ